jgi:hypothetical protein
MHWRGFQTLGGGFSRGFLLRWTGWDDGKDDMMSDHDATLTLMMFRSF